MKKTISALLAFLMLLTVALPGIPVYAEETVPPEAASEPAGGVSAFEGEPVYTEFTDDKGNIWEYETARAALNRDYPWLTDDGNRQYIKEHFYNNETPVLDDTLCVKLKELNQTENTELVVPSVIEGKNVTVMLWGAVDNMPVSSVTLPQTLVFYGRNTVISETITTINIPAACIFVNEGAFQKMSALEAITVSEGNPYYYAENGVLYANASCGNIPDEENTRRELVAYPPAKSNCDENGGLTWYIPETIYSLGWECFANTTGLRGSVVIPDSVIRIEGSAFDGSAVTDLTVGANVEYIGLKAFRSNTDLTLNFNSAAMDKPFIDWDDLTWTEDNKREYFILNPDKAVTCIYYKYSALDTYFSNYPTTAYSNVTYTELDNPSLGSTYEDASGCVWAYRPLSEMVTEHYKHINNGERKYCYDKLIANGDINSLLSVRLIAYVGEAGDLGDANNPITVTVPDVISTADGDKTVGGLEPEAMHYPGIGSVTLNSGLRFLGDSILADSSVTSIDIPASVCYVDESTFNNARMLSAITVDDANEYYFDDDGVLYAHAPCGEPVNYENNIPLDMELVTFPRGKAAENYVLPEGITSLGWQCCKEAEYLTGAITVPSTVTHIGWGALAETGLSEITVDMNEGWIGLHAFQTNSEQLVLNFTSQNMRSDAFNVEWSEEWNDEGKIHKLIVCPERLQSVSCYERTGIAKYFKAHLGDNESVHYLENLGSENVYIDENGFIWEYFVARDVINEHYSYIHEYDRNHTYHDYVGTDLPDNSYAVRLIASDNSDLDDPAANITVTVPSHINGREVTALAINAINGSGITSIILPDTLRFIPNDTTNDTSVTTINIPANVSFIAEGAFRATPTMTSITVDGNNTYYYIYNDMLYGKGYRCSETEYDDDENIVRVELVACPNGLALDMTDYVFPSNLGSIGGNACAESGKLTGKLTIPDTVTFIGFAAFENVPFSEVVVGKNVENLEGRAFYRRSDLGLENGLVITFKGDLANVPVRGNLQPTLDENEPSLIFINPEFTSSCTYYTATAYEKYFNDLIANDGAEYNAFSSILHVLENDFAFIYEDADSGSGLKIVGTKGTAPNGGTVEIPASVDGKDVMEIAVRAFAENNGIVSVSIPETVYFIDNEAFYGCANLETVYIAAADCINHCAFANCPKLKTVTFGFPCFNYNNNIFENSGSPTVNIPKIDGYKDFYNTDEFEERTGSTVTSTATLNPITDADGCIYVVVDGLAIIIGYDGDGGDVTVPAALGGHKVAKIMPGAFYSVNIDRYFYDSAEQTQLPYDFASYDDMDTIRERKFIDVNGDEHYIMPRDDNGNVPEGKENARPLTSITLPEGLVTVMCDAFAANPFLKTVTLATDIISLNGGFIYHTPLLESITFKDAGGIHNISDNRFYALDGAYFVSLRDHVTYAYIPSSPLAGVTTIVPEKVRGVEIWDVGSSTFAGAQNLAAITVGDNINGIHGQALRYLPSLKTLYIGANLEWSDSYPIFCGSFKNYVVSDSNENFVVNDNILYRIERNDYGISDIVLASAASVTNEHLIIPDELPGYGPVTVTGTCSIFRNLALKEITLGANIREMRRESIIGCGNVADITLNEGLESMGFQVITECFSLTSITIPSTVTQIDANAFWHDDNLSEVIVNCSPWVFDRDYIIFRGEFDGNICNIGEKPFHIVTMKLNNNPVENPYTDIYLQGCLIVGNCDTSGDTYRDRDVLIVGENALVDYNSGVYGDIPGAKMIPDSYRNEIAELLEGAKVVVMPSDTKIVGERAFAAIYGEKNDDNHVSENLHGAFFKSGAADVIIGAEAFQSTSIKFFDFSTVKEIHNTAFNCANLLGIMADPLDLNNVSRIDTDAFRNNNDIEAVIVSDKWICSPDEGNPFIECHGLRKFIVADDSVNFYVDGNGALHSKVNNTDVLISANLNVEANALYIIPDGTNVIAPAALYSLRGAAVVRIPASVEKIGDYAFSGYFEDGVSYIERFEVAAGNANYATDASGVLFEIVTSETTETYARLVQAPNATKLREYTVPNTINGAPVRIIGTDAFARINSIEKLTLSDNVKVLEVWSLCGMSNLKTLEMSANIVSINDDAISNCTSLVSVTLPSTIEHIGYIAFAGCTSLANISIAKDAPITEISEEAFADCVSLASITLPININIIKEKAFINCVKLTSVMFTGDVPDSIAADAFEGVDMAKLTLCFDGNVIIQQPYIKNIDNIIAFLSSTDKSLVYIDENQLGDDTPTDIGDIPMGSALASYNAKVTDPEKLTVSNDNPQSITVVLAPSSSKDNSSVDLSVGESSANVDDFANAETVEEVIDTEKVETIDIKLTDKVTPETVVEPDAPVVIRLPLGDRNPDTLVVYHLHDGVYDKVNHWYETADGTTYIVFTVDSFSDFFFAAVKVDGDTTGDGYFDLRDVTTAEAAAKLFEKGDGLSAKSTEGTAALQFKFSSATVRKGDTLELTVIADAATTAYGLKWNTAALALEGYTKTTEGQIYTANSSENEIRVIQKGTSFKVKFVALRDLTANDIDASVYLTGVGGGFETKAATNGGVMMNVDFTGYSEANLIKYRRDGDIYYTYGYTGSTEGWSNVVDMNSGAIQTVIIDTVAHYIVPSELTLTGYNLYEAIGDDVQGDGKIFAGWYYTDKLTGEEKAPAADEIIPAGTPLYAKYITIDNDDPAYSYQLPGLQIRTEGVKGLRFRTEIGMSLLRDVTVLNDDNILLGMPQSMTYDIGYGTLFTRQANYSASDAKLVKDEESGRYILSSKPVINIARLKAADSDGTKLVYNTVIIGIEPTYYSIEIAARPFISYRDANGSLRTFYYTEAEPGEYFAGGGYSASLKRAADFIKTYDWNSYSEQQQAYIQSIIDYGN